MTTEEITPERRTKRRYAHELYPHGKDCEARPLAVEVPYMYSRAIGFEVGGTGWFDEENRSIAGARTHILIDSRLIAFSADALLQGLTGQDAWDWIIDHASDETGELAYERAVEYGVDPDLIKPYPCGDERGQHDHLGEPDARGWRTVTRVQGKESECEECTELVTPEASTS